MKPAPPVTRSLTRRRLEAERATEAGDIARAGLAGGNEDSHLPTTLRKPKTSRPLGVELQAPHGSPRRAVKAELEVHVHPGQRVGGVRTSRQGSPGAPELDSRPHVDCGDCGC